MHSGDLVACAWHDTKHVHFLGTVQNDLRMDKEIRHKGSEGGKRTVVKPFVTDWYNNNIAGVDRTDQLLGSCHILRNPRSGTNLFTTESGRLLLSMVTSSVSRLKTPGMNRFCLQRFSGESLLITCSQIGV